MPLHRGKPRSNRTLLLLLASISSLATAAPTDDIATSDFTSASSFENGIRPDGQPGFPLQGKPITPRPAEGTTAVVDNTYYSDFKFNVSDFKLWCDARKEIEGKILKIALGTYEFPLDAEYPDGLKPSDLGGYVPFWSYPVGVTLDLTDVTISIPITAETMETRNEAAFYVNNAPEFKIVGGTIWFDMGELYSYARIESIAAAPDGAADGGGQQQLVTIKLLDGYDATVWTAEKVGEEGPLCMDVSGLPQHAAESSCDWNALKDYTFDPGTRTATAKVTTGGQQQQPEGIVQGLGLLKKVHWQQTQAVRAEWQGGLRVEGLTTNGGFAQIGSTNGGATMTVVDSRMVNPPLRPGFGPRYGGASMRTVLYFPSYDGPGLPAIEFPGSRYQSTGGEGDFLDLYSVTPG